LRFAFFLVFIADSKSFLFNLKLIKLSFVTGSKVISVSINKGAYVSKTKKIPNRQNDCRGMRWYSRVSRMGFYTGTNSLCHPGLLIIRYYGPYLFHSCSYHARLRSINHLFHEKDIADDLKWHFITS
jgi:hypothetical protein